MQKLLALKIIIIFIVGILVLIPISMVQFKVYERQGYLEQAKSAVAQSWTGPQLVMTPVLVIPYHLSVITNSGFIVDGQNKLEEKFELVLPKTIQNTVKVSNKSIFKGIYEVPVYNSEITLTGKFSAELIDQHMAQIKSMPHFENLETPYLSVYISDVRGLDKAPSLTVNNTPVVLKPGSQIAALAGGLHGTLSNFSEWNSDLSITLDLSLRGMGNLSFIQFADTASTSLNSDWPHPEFIGASLPVEREISSSGFTANWSSTRYSSNSPVLLKQCINSHECQELLTSASGVKFIEPVDIYLQSERSVKYAMLFIGLSFITFFIFEHIRQIRIHPIQYAFVGLAIAVFYLLLISLAEHIAFHWAYSIAVICCTSLLLFYVRYMLKSLWSAALFSLMLMALYGLLYVIIQAEDFALLMGALLVFLVLSTLMYSTRKIDWYDLGSTDEALAPKSDAF